jgi:hypothetical protein
MDMLQTLRDVTSHVANLQDSNAGLEDEVMRLKMALSEANGVIKTLQANNVDLKDRLSDAVKDATYFREKVGVVTQAATEWSDKMVTLMKDVERKPKPMLSLDDLEEKPSPAPTPIVNGPRHLINLTSKEWLEIASMPEGVEFTIAPEPDLDRTATKTWYRNKLGHVPSGYKSKPEVMLRRVNDKLEFIRFVFPEERRSVRPEHSTLPNAPNIPSTSSVGDFDNNGRLGGTDEIPAFLRQGPQNGGPRADITSTETPEH